LVERQDVEKKPKEPVAEAGDRNRKAAEGGSNGVGWEKSEKMGLGNEKRRGAIGRRERRKQPYLQGHGTSQTRLS
jgi:hypothetical protein